MKPKETQSRRSVQRMVRRLLRGKYKDSCAPCSSVAGALREELNSIGVAECDHLIAVMNMSPNAGTQRPGTPDVSLATETRKPGSLKPTVRHSVSDGLIQPRDEQMDSVMLPPSGGQLAWAEMIAEENAQNDQALRSAPTAPTTSPQQAEPGSLHPAGSVGWITADGRLDKWNHCTDTVCVLEVAQSDPLYGLQGCKEWQSRVLRETAEKWSRAADLLVQRADELDPPNA